MDNNTVRIIEVGPRDGLQSLGTELPVELRIEWIKKLSSAGLCEIEAGSFVRHDRVPSMANSEDVFRGSNDLPIKHLWALVPNLRGWKRASESGATAFAFFTSASETFSQKNSSCSIEQSIEKFSEIKQAVNGSPLRAYLSCSFGCPYEDQIPVKNVAQWAKKLQLAGADEIVISDTTGVATKASVSSIASAVLAEISVQKVSLHLHDTHGSAVDCARVGWESGIRSFDSSAGGLGGCPFAPGAPGNVATEDLVSLFESLGIDTGIDLQQLKESSAWLAGIIQSL
ncbi:MAG: hydroxymethylglutaryl-CoA lyase [Planctomycetota bacterium]